MRTGVDLLRDPRLNRGTAFTHEERARLGLEGLLPETVDEEAVLLERCRAHLAAKPTALERYVYMSELEDRDERLFYQLLRSDIAQYMPVVYTPTVGEACQQFGHILRRPKGMWLGLRHRGRLRELLRNWPDRDTRFIVVTDGERILGLGDLGANGMGIPVGKLALYTAVAGVPPEATLPVLLDVGTNNADLLADPLYPGLRERRVTGEAYLSFVDEFVAAVQEVFPRCCIQFEDFANPNAIPLLRRYRDRACVFNDDVQGTAGVALAGLLGAARATGLRLRDLRLAFLGAGSAAVGIADLVALEMQRQGLPAAEARARCLLVNSRGLVTARTTGLSEQQQPYAHDLAPAATLLEVVERHAPHAIIGVSSQPGAFTRPVIEAMARRHARPIVFPYSNPTSRSECTAQEAIEWSGGRAIFASGSPFPPVTYGGRTFTPGQGNNVYVYPAVGLAVYATGASRVPDALFLRAAEALSREVSPAQLEQGIVYPPVARIAESSLAVACAVADEIVRLGLATDPRVTAPGADVAAHVRAVRYAP